MRNDPLGIPLISSCFIHVVVILIASIIIHNSNLSRQHFLPISLVDLPRKEKATPIQPKEILPEIKKRPPPPSKPEKITELKPLGKSDVAQPKQTLLPALPNEETAKPVEAKPMLTERSENAASSAPTARAESGGSEAGAGSLFSKGDIGVVPGPGSSGGGGGTAVSGLGRGSNAPGLPTQSVILKTNREAKPIQTVRAAYPPLALRMGMEGDVTIRIEVDTEGKVTRAEIMKGAGAGFDEEALKAVKQSRFEPAQKDGQNVPAEFTYVYRFRMAR